jgi:hypothetical protein
MLEYWLLVINIVNADIEGCPWFKVRKTLKIANIILVIILYDKPFLIKVHNLFSGIDSVYASFIVLLIVTLYITFWLWACYIINAIISECWYSYNHTFHLQGPSWSWSYGSWIYNYLCNQCLSPYHH